MPNAEVITLFAHAFGVEEGYICIASKNYSSKKFDEAFFEWPEDKSAMFEYIEHRTMSHDLWFCPNLLTNRRRIKENIAHTPTAWADLDFCHPDLIQIKPTVIVESSPSRFQALWRLEGDVAPLDAESISRRIAYFHQDDGCDTSGWDLTQLLRIPGTFNFKYEGQGEAVVVKILHAGREIYPIEEFGSYPQPPEFAYSDLPMPDSFPDTKTVWAKYSTKLLPISYVLATTDPKLDDDWSKSLWNLEMMFFEAGANLAEVYSVAYDAKCNKYARDGRSPQYLWREVCRAFQASEEIALSSGPSMSEYLPELLTDVEREECRRVPTFVEDYIEWAKTTGDAAWQYHQAGAFIILSSLLAGLVKLDTSFGTVSPHLWFMILADTTLTRKTTAMDLAIELVKNVDEDVVMATDGSMEGLMTAIAGRPNRPSIFLRDEFTGLLEQMTKKDYYSGMAETLTKLYDGKDQKRILKRETLDIRDPLLILFAGGIKNRTFELLNYEHISSGFLPRFVFITAEVDLMKIKPLGPPTEETTEEKDKLIERLKDLHEFYNSKQNITVNAKVKVATPKIWKAKLTSDAWFRYNLYEAMMLKAGQESLYREVLTPMFDRLCKSGLKAAMLIAASRKDENIVVSEDDIIRAFYYVEQWRGFSMEIVKNIGRTNFEKSAEQAMNAIKSNPGIYRSDIMRRLSLTSKSAEELLRTLDERGLIKLKKSGTKTIRYWAVENEGDVIAE